MLASGLDELRYEPTGKRIRAVLGGGIPCASCLGLIRLTDIIRGSPPQGCQTMEAHRGARVGASPMEFWGL